MGSDFNPLTMGNNEYNHIYIILFYLFQVGLVAGTAFFIRHPLRWALLLAGMLSPVAMIFGGFRPLNLAGFYSTLAFMILGPVFALALPVLYKGSAYKKRKPQEKDPP